MLHKQISHNLVSCKLTFLCWQYFFFFPNASIKLIYRAEFCVQKKINFVHIILRNSNLLYIFHAYSMCMCWVNIGSVESHVHRLRSSSLTPEIENIPIEGMMGRWVWRYCVGWWEGIRMLIIGILVWWVWCWWWKKKICWNDMGRDLEEDWRIPGLYVLKRTQESLISWTGRRFSRTELSLDIPYTWQWTLMHLSQGKKKKRHHNQTTPPIRYW